MVDCIVPNTKSIPIEIGQQFNDNSLVSVNLIEIGILKVTVIF